MNKKQMYESIMRNVAKEVKKALNEGKSYNSMPEGLRNCKTLNDMMDYYMSIGLDENDISNLLYILNSDRHIVDEGMETVSTLTDYDFSPYALIQNKPLYRGCNKWELDEYLKTGLSEDVYLSSFSEDINVAKTFGTEVITLLPSNHKLFCFHKFLEDYYEQIIKIDEEYADMLDAEYQLEVLKKESEWIICLNKDSDYSNYKLRCVDPEKRIFKVVKRRQRLY